MAPAKPLSSEPVSKRLHIGGLAPSVTPKDLVQRFSSFGTVAGGEKGVDGLGTSANGLPRSFAFFTLETSEAKFAKCMSMLNGSTWKSHKLRIGLAKPDWQERRAAEREEARAAEVAPVRPKKRKRSKDPNVGMAATHFELGWVLDTKPAAAPLFPLLVRPPHPIEAPAKPAATAWTRGAGKAKPSKAAREAARLGIELEKAPLRRAKRLRIDPRRWGRTKLVYDATKENESAKMLAVGTWECEEVQQGETEPKAIWVFKARDGTVKLRETVRLSQNSTYTDNFTAIIDRMNRPPPLPSAAAVNEITLPPAVASSSASSASSNADEDDVPRSRSKRVKSASPPPYIPAAPRNLIYNEEDAFQLMAAALGDDERAAAHAQERSELLKLAVGVVAEVAQGQTAELETVDVAAPAAAIGKAADGRPLPKVEGFADDSDDDTDLFPAMRLRGGGGAGAGSSDESSSDSDSDDDSSSSDDEESSSSSDSERSSKTEKQATDEDTKMAETEAEAPKTTLAKGLLKDMFKPQEESGGFSLLSGLDLDLDPVERSPSPAPIPLPTAAPVPRFVPTPAFRQQRTAAVPSGPSLPFFAFPSADFEDRATGELVQEEAEKLGLSEIAVQRAKAESQGRMAKAAKHFWRHESMDQIEEEHQKLRELLRGVARKRHREAVKRTKKKAGRRGAGVALDIVDDE
ncbi:hypothetical protein JCM10213v2_006733 [Rhodosporidiobolus nylandii]